MTDKARVHMSYLEKKKPLRYEKYDFCNTHTGKEFLSKLFNIKINCLA